MDPDARRPRDASDPPDPDGSRDREGAPDLRASLVARDDLPRRRGRRRSVEVVGVDESLLPVVDEAINHLVQRIGVARDELVVEAAGPVTWSDGSCGCPEPGRAYPQVPVDGVYVRLSAAGRLFHYHGGGRRSLFLCDG